MKMLVLILTIFFTTASLSWAGGTEVGNGSDELDNTAGAAWFIGQQKPIRACVDVAEGFGLSAKEARREVKKAFSAWPTFVKEKNLYRPPTFQYPWSGYIEFNPENIPNMRLNLSDKDCTGNEDLTILLGVENELVQKDKTRFRNPVAFAKRTSYDLEKGWGRGYIWVRSAAPTADSKTFPNWSHPGQLNLILKHEFGHVFGVGHHSDTIMAADIAKRLQQDYEMSADDLSGPSEATLELAAAVKGLDFQRSLDICRECPERLRYAEGGVPLLQGAREIINLKENRIYLISCSIENFVPARFAFNMQCEMKGKVYQWKVKSVEEIQGLGNGDLFKTCNKETSNCSGGKISSLFSWMGFLVDEKGQSHLVKVKRGYGTNRFNFLTVDLVKSDGTSEPIFWRTADQNGRMD